MRRPQSHSHGARQLAVGIALAALVACSSAPPRPVTPAPPVPPPARTSPRPPADLGAIADAVPRSEPRAAHGNPPFYDVLGRRYLVLASADGYRERGVASWYGPDFHGVATSIGEPYDMYGMTAAHKTLPLPCYVRVTNLRNGRSVVVRVNDRGPFVANRIIDLSYTAAAKLDMLREGTAFVEVRVVSPAAVADAPLNADQTRTASNTSVPDISNAPAAAAAAPMAAMFLQAGAFAEEANALRLVERLHTAGLANAFVHTQPGAAARLFKVRVGPVHSVADFDRLVARLAELGVPDARLALE